MEWNMLEESKKLFPHWLDKSSGSNFTKHLTILNNQQRVIRHNLKCIDWSRLINKPLQIHKVQTEPHKWKVEFEVNVPRLKEVNIYKNPTIYNGVIINNKEVINGYYFENNFYENINTELTDTFNGVVGEDTFQESDYSINYTYSNIITPEINKFYYDLGNKKYYQYSHGKYNIINVNNVPETSLIYSESFIDNYSHFFRHIHYEDNSSDVTINKYIIDEENNIENKKILVYPDTHLTDEENERIIKHNGKYELNIIHENDDYCLHYNISDDEYYIFKDDKFIKIDKDKIIWIDYEVKCNITTSTNENNEEITNYEYSYIDDNNKNIIINIDNEDGLYYIFADYNNKGFISKIPLIETTDITPIISNDKYVLEVKTWNDYHFCKGFPETDFIDYNNNNIIDTNERNYDNLNITIETIGDKEYLTFRVHQYGIKLIEIFKDEKPIHIADFIIEKLEYNDKQINTNFAHIYNYNTNEVYYPYLKDSDTVEEVNLDVDEYVWRLPITEEDKIYDENRYFELKNNYDIQVTYYDSTNPYDDTLDKILRKRYVCEDTIFYHDISLDVLGTLYNVPRHVFTQPYLETQTDKIDFYSKTYPTYCNTLSEDDYHYQKRLEYYIQNYNKIYFPCLELWKYFHIDSKLENRKVIIAEQNYSYLRTLSAKENKYINELGKNQVKSFYNTYDNKSTESSIIGKPKYKSLIPSSDYLHSRNGILVDENDNYIRDINGNVVKLGYDYTINEYGEYEVKYENITKEVQWYIAKQKDNLYQIKLTDLLKVVPNTKYQLRFCVKNYPTQNLHLRIVYKKDDENIMDVVDTIPERKDYDATNEYNELIYTNYNTEFNIPCEYICTDFLTLENAKNIEIILESRSYFKISDVTLQRITINHYDSEYMKTSTDYNSCVYDLYADYNSIPSNIKYNDLNIFNKILNRSLPVTKVGFFRFILESNNFEDNMKLDTETNIYINNLLDVESGILDKEDSVEEVELIDNEYQYTYRFNKYIKQGDYEIILKTHDTNQNIVYDVKIDINMTVFQENNTAKPKIISTDLTDYYDEDNNYFKIPFYNLSDSNLEIKIHHTKPFGFEDFKLIRKSPLTMEEIIRK